LAHGRKNISIPHTQPTHSFQLAARRAAKKVKGGKRG